MLQRPKTYGTYGLPVPPRMNGNLTVRRWHRLRTVREREGISLKTVSRRSHVGVPQLRQEEDETRDLTLSQLYVWQRALRVPISELMVDAEDSLDEKIRLRCAMLRLTRTAKTILRESRTATVRNLAQTMLNQIYEVMPEAAAMGPWNEVGQRRSPQDVPRIVEQTVPTGPTGLWRLGDETVNYTTCDL